MAQNMKKILYATKEQDEEVAEDSTTLHSHDKCTEIYNTMELRLREIEAYMTSKRFRLHCDINRIKSILFQSRWGHWFSRGP